MDNIKIYDNFFDKNDLDYIIKCTTNISSNCACITRDYQNRFGACSYFQTSLMDNSFFTNYCKQLICDKICKRKFRFLRCNFMSQSYGQTGSFHVDHPQFDSLTQYKNGQDPNTLEFTIMLYININDTNESTSSIVFKTDQKYFIEVETKHNRVLFFPGYYYHYPAHYVNSNDIRMSITFKCEYLD
jgi:hypothetical protein